MAIWEKGNKRLLNELKEKPIGSTHQLDVNEASAADEFDQLKEIPPPISNDPVTTNKPVSSCSENEAGPSHFSAILPNKKKDDRGPQK